MKQIINVFILTTVLFITGTTSFAQEPDGQADAVQYDFSTFTINGFEVAGPEYTEQDIIRVFGQPDSVGYEFGKSYLYERKTKILNREVGTGDYYIQITLSGNPGSIIYMIWEAIFSSPNGGIKKVRYIGVRPVVAMRIGLCVLKSRMIRTGRLPVSVYVYSKTFASDLK